MGTIGMLIVWLMEPRFMVAVWSALEAAKKRK
jgi:hypothetical protein